MLMGTLSAFADILTGYVLVNGEKATAEYTKLTNSTVALGSGQNACISQYTQGRVTVPSTVVISGTTYTVTEISSMAFRLCTKMTFVEVSENVKRIGNFAFVGCKGLREVVLPASLETIGTGAFIDLPLKRVFCAGSTPATWEYNDVFKFHEGGISDEQSLYIGSSVRLTVPEDALETYQDALYSDETLGWTTPDGWGHFSSFNNDFKKNWRIYLPEDLEALREYLNGDAQGDEVERATVENDIDMTNRPTWTYGLSRWGTEPFTGIFDGQGHTIKGLNVINPDEPYIGLFNFFAGDTIRNLTLESCKFEGKGHVGSLAGAILSNPSRNKPTIIENVFSSSDVTGSEYIGGLVGSAVSAYYLELNINHCVFNGSVEWQPNSSYNEANCGMGGLVGLVRDANIKGCAVWGGARNLSNIHCGPFVGYTKLVAYTGDQRVTVEKSYQFDRNSDQLFPDYRPDINTDHIYLKNDVILAGRDTYKYYYSENDQSTLTYLKGNMYGFIMASSLGTDDWVYKYGERPLPYSFENLWPVEINVFTIRPQGLEPRTNGLSPVGTFPPEAWHSNIKQGDLRDFHYREFIASDIWFDDNVAPDYTSNPQILPIGNATITATDGVIYERELKAIHVGEKTQEVPVYETDGEGNILEDSEGNPIETGEYVELYDGEEYTPVGYSLYLPYDLTLSPFCKLYQPYKVTYDGGATIATFKEIKNKTAEAFKPYYVVVEQETEPLRTYTEEVCPPLTDTNAIDLGNFEFVGTNQKISNYTASKDKSYILQSDGKWHKVELQPSDNATAYIPAFRAYFRATGNGSSNTLSMAFADDSTTGITIQTIDADGTEHYYDLNGRRLPGKPSNGAYIYQGKKYLNK